MELTFQNNPPQPVISYPSYYESNVHNRYLELNNFQVQTQNVAFAPIFPKYYSVVLFGMLEVGNQPLNWWFYFLFGYNNYIYYFYRRDQKVENKIWKRKKKMKNGVITQIPWKISKSAFKRDKISYYALRTMR